MEIETILLIVSTSLAAFCFFRRYIYQRDCCPIILRYNDRIIKKPLKYFFITIRFVSIVSGFCAIAQFIVKKEKTIDKIHIATTGISIGASAIQIINDIILLFIHICENPKNKPKRISSIIESLNSDISDYHNEINYLYEILENL